MIRDYDPADDEQLANLHRAQGFDYRMPDLKNPLFLVKKVREVNGRVVGACVLRITAEAYLLVGGGPIEKARSIEELQPEVLREAYEKGLSDIVCVLPPEIAESFGPVLEDKRLGWSRDRDWPMYSRELNAQCNESGQSG